MKTSSLFLIAGMLFLMACTNEKGSDKSKENNTSTTIEASPPKSMSQSKILIDTVSTITELDTIVPTTLVIDSIPDSILARRAAFLRYSIDPSQIWLSFPFDMNRDDPWDTRVSGNTVSFNEWGFEYLDSCIFVYLEPYSRSKMEYPQVVDTFRLEAEADSYEEDLYGEESMLFRKVKNPHFVICGLKAKEGYVPGLKPTPSDFGHPKYLGDTISIRLNNQTYYIFTEAEQRDTVIDGKKKTAIDNYTILVSSDTSTFELLSPGETFRSEQVYGDYMSGFKIVYWMGDLDQDGRLDIVTYDRLSLQGCVYTLYLSSYAEEGELMKKITTFAGCLC